MLYRLTRRVGKPRSILSLANAPSRLKRDHGHMMQQREHLGAICRLVGLARPIGVAAILEAVLLSAAAYATPPPENVDQTQQADPPVDSAPLPLRISVSGLMLSLIHDAASNVSALAHSEPMLSESQWREVALSAINLVGAASLVTMEGAGDMDAARAANPDWRIWATQMQTAGVALAYSVRNRDQTQLVQASTALAQTCKSCHEQFAPAVAEKLKPAG